MNLGVIKFGTDNTAQAIALILTLVILFLLMVLIFCAPANSQTEDVISLLKNTLLLTVGVAVGNSLPKKSD